MADLIRTGVERFILKESSIGEFWQALKNADRKGEFSAHPLTREAFSRIVRQATSEWKRRRKNPPRP